MLKSHIWAPKGVAYWSTKWVKNHELSNSSGDRQTTLGDFFLYYLTLVDIVTNKYPVKLVDVSASWPAHHG